MEGLTSLLIFGGLFYLMMRFGCGAHRVHGHHEGHSSKAEPENRHLDPVCGKPINPKEGYGKMQADHLYRFCSRQCLDAFEADPDRYTKKQIEATP